MELELVSLVVCILSVVVVGRWMLAVLWDR